MNSYILNNTENYHSGSAAVMQALRRQLRDAGHDIIGEQRTGEVVDPDAIDEATWVIANGEGTLHGHATNAVIVMDGLKLAQERGKKTALVNCIWQTDPPWYGDVLERLDYFSVREPISQAQAEACGRRPEVRLDLCTDRGPDGEPFMALSGVVNGHGGRIPGAPKVRLKQPFPDVVATLAQADVYITQEQHGVYAAGLAGIGFVPLKIDFHKIAGLIGWSGCEIPIVDLDDTEGINRGIEYARDCPEVFRDFHNFLMDGPKLRVAYDLGV